MPKGLLHLVCYDTDIKAARALLANDAVNVNTRDKWGQSSAYIAVAFRQYRTLELLCAAGADLLACADNGLSPLDYALSRYNAGGQRNAFKHSESKVPGSHHGHFGQIRALCVTLSTRSCSNATPQKGCKNFTIWTSF
jgi:hypothetical protein